MTGGVVPEEHVDGAVSVVNHFPCNQEVQLDRLYVRVEVAPAKYLLKSTRAANRVSSASELPDLILFGQAI